LQSPLKYQLPVPAVGAAVPAEVAVAAEPRSLQD
jgi:hypothetical protein